MNDEEPQMVGKQALLSVEEPLTSGNQLLTPTSTLEPTSTLSSSSFSPFSMISFPRCFDFFKGASCWCFFKSLEKRSVRTSVSKRRGVERLQRCNPVHKASRNNCQQDAGLSSETKA